MNLTLLHEPIGTPVVEGSHQCRFLKGWVMAAAFCLSLIGAPVVEALASTTGERSRLIVLADMGHDPDEEQQMVHLLACSNQVDIEGLVLVAGRFFRPNPTDSTKWLQPHLFHRIIDAYAEANHHPRAAIDGDSSFTIIRRAARPGETLVFDASASTDPDGDALTFLWWIYSEAGRAPYGKPLSLAAAATTPRVTFVVPSDAAGRELHLILEVTDRHPGLPLTAYRRVVITVD